MIIHKIMFDRAGLPSVYLKGDVCPEELLVEIERFAYLDFQLMLY